MRARIENNRLATAPIEGNAVLADPTAEGHRLTVWLSTQHPHLGQRLLARLTGLDPADIRVVAPHVGGAFGGKAGISPDHAAVVLAALALGRPVAWTETRSEAMLSMHGRGQVQYAELGLTRDGPDHRPAGPRDRRLRRLRRLRRQLLRPAPPAPWRRAPTSSRGSATTPSRWSPAPARSARSAAPAAPRRPRCSSGSSTSPPTSSASPRRRSGAATSCRPTRSRGTTFAGRTYDSGDYDLPLTEALRLADVDGARAEQARRRDAGDPRQLGIGIASYVEITGFGGSEMGHVEVHDDGSATVRSGTSAHGQGHATAFSMIAADRLGIPMERITYEQSDTAVVPRGGGTGGARSLQMGGQAVEQASTELLEKATRLAADLLEASADDVELGDDGFAVRGVPDGCRRLGRPRPPRRRAAATRCR